MAKRNAVKAAETVKSTEDMARDGYNLLARAYHLEVLSIVEDIIKTHKATPFANRREVSEHVDATLDGYSWVIYTFYANVVCMCSDNSDAMQDETGETGEVSARAFYALRADVTGRLDSDLSFDDEDDSE